jgi:hypothetical protein
MAYAVHTRSCTYLLDDDGVCRWTLAPTGVPVAGADRYLGAQFVACLDVREIGGLVGELRIGAAALFARSENGRFVLLRTPSIEHVEHRADDGSEPEITEPVPPQPEPQPSLPAYTPYVEPLPAYAPRASAAPPAYSTPAYAPPAPPVHATPQYLPPPAAPVYVAPRYRAPEPTAVEYSAPDYSAPVYAEPEEPALSTHTLPLPLAPPRTVPPPPPAPYAWPYAPEPEIAPEDEYIEEIDVEELVTFSEVTLTIPLYRPETQTVKTVPRRGVIGPGRRLR